MGVLVVVVDGVGSNGDDGDEQQGRISGKRVKMKPIK